VYTKVIFIVVNGPLVRDKLQPACALLSNKRFLSVKIPGFLSVAFANTSHVCQQSFQMFSFYSESSDPNTHTSTVCSSSENKKTECKVSPCCSSPAGEGKLTVPAHTNSRLLLSTCSQSKALPGPSLRPSVCFPPEKV